MTRLLSSEESGFDKGLGFFDIKAARQSAADRRSVLVDSVTRKAAQSADVLISTSHENGREAITAPLSCCHLALEHLDCFSAGAINQYVDGGNEAHDRRLQCVHLVFEQFDLLLDGNPHQSLLADSSNVDGRGHPDLAEAETEADREGSVLRRALRILGGTTIGDVAGLIALFVILIVASSFSVLQ